MLQTKFGPAKPPLDGFGFLRIHSTAMLLCRTTEQEIEKRVHRIVTIHTTVMNEIYVLSFLLDSC